MKAHEMLRGEALIPQAAAGGAKRGTPSASVPILLVILAGEGGAGSREWDIFTFRGLRPSGKFSGRRGDIRTGRGSFVC